MNVGRIVPVMRKQFGLRRTPAPQMRHTNAPVSEIRERDNGPRTDPQHAAQHPQRIARLLQSLAEDDVIESPVGIIVERGFEIALVYGNSACDSLLRASARLLYAARVHLLVVAQP